MKLVNIALASIAFLGLATVGCANNDTASSPASLGGSGSETTLGTSESQLVTDDSDSADADDSLESGIDEPLSGAATNAPGAPAAGKTLAEVLAKVKANAGKFFAPAGCLTSTAESGTITHVFKNCSGPYGMKTFDGTVTSTYAVGADGTITITHAADGFTANGATISGSRVVTYKEEGSVWTKHRTGTWSGETASGKTLSHDASFVTTYDAATQCLTRDGSAQSTVGGRSFERTVDGYKRCGIGNGGCPDAGELTLSTTKSETTSTVKINFEGGRKYSVTRPSGRVVERTLVCNPRAS